MAYNHLEEIVELNPLPPTDLYVERQIVCMCESNIPSIIDHESGDFSLKFKTKYRLSESYSFAMQFSDYTALDSIAGLISETSGDAPALWVQGPLADIVKETTAPEHLLAELKEREITLLNYHPTQKQALAIRRQFFARIRALEKLYKTIFETIAGSTRSVYERELKNQPRVRSFSLDY